MPNKRKTTDPFNRALATFLEWGPAMEIPVEQRLKKVLPRATKKQISDLIKTFTGLQFSASSIVIDQLERKATEEDGRSRVAALDPRLSPDNAATLYSQSRIYAWRDGYK
jgi:hypothetical protein